MALSKNKLHLRRETLALLRALPREARVAKSAALVERLVEHPALRAAEGRCVLAFAALPSEPDLSSLSSRVPGIRLCLPRVIGSERLTIHHVTDFDHLVPSEKGISEPDPALHPEIALADIAVVLVPGLAFSTRTGHRLGRGGGYYDRFLARPEIARARRVGVCFDEQALIAVPFEAHDCRVDEIVTDRRHLHVS